MIRILLILMITPMLNAMDNFTLAKRNWKSAIAEIPQYPEGNFSGRGIVIPAGGTHYLINAYVNLNVLRDSGCQLPVEIWYIGEKEIVPAIMKKLEGLGAVCKDVTHYYPYPIKGYEVKIHAIMASSFEEVMLLDADNVVFQNPDFLFETAKFIETGALFWPDIQVLKKSNPLWHVLDLPAQDLRAQESGQLVIDKRRCWAPLHLCLHLNKESHFYYQHILGDKDTFQLSWMVMQAPFHIMEHHPGMLKSLKPKSKKEFGQIQRDFNGNPLFCHTTTWNWAERTNDRKLFFNYTLPRRAVENLHRGQDQIFTNFQVVYPNLEPRCIKYMKEARELL